MSFVLDLQTVPDRHAELGGEPAMFYSSTSVIACGSTVSFGPFC
ncbi:SapB/AmfS family lanthipeptide [Streptomyces milbemycinicus]